MVGGQMRASLFWKGSADAIALSEKLSLMPGRFSSLEGDAKDKGIPQLWLIYSLPSLSHTHPYPFLPSVCCVDWLGITSGQGWVSVNVLVEHSQASRGR